MMWVAYRSYQCLACGDRWVVGPRDDLGALLAWHLAAQHAGRGAPSLFTLWRVWRSGRRRRYA